MATGGRLMSLAVRIVKAMADEEGFACRLCAGEVCDTAFNTFVFACHHPFCLNCIKSLREDRTTLRCPVCKSALFARNDDVDNSPGNAALLDASTSVVPAEKPPSTNAADTTPRSSANAAHGDRSCGSAAGGKPAAKLRNTRSTPKTSSGHSTTRSTDTTVAKAGDVSVPNDGGVAIGSIRTTPETSSRHSKTRSTDTTVVNAGDVSVSDDGGGVAIGSMQTQPETSSRHSNTRSTDTTVANAGDVSVPDGGGDGVAIGSIRTLLGDAQFCDTHRTDSVDHYCHNCNAMLCVKCRAQDDQTHDGHRCEPIGEALSTCVKRMSIVENLYGTWLTDVDNAVAGLQQNWNSVGQEFQAGDAELKAAIDGDAGMIEKELIDAELENNKVTADAIQKIARIKGILQDLLKDCDAETIDRSSIGRDLERILAEYVLASRRAASGMEIIDVDLKFSDEQPGPGRLIGQLVRTVRTEPPVEDAPLPGRAIDTERGIVAMALLGSVLYVCRDRCPQILVYDVTSNETLPPLAPVTGFDAFMYSGLAACAANNRLYVSDYINDVVDFVDLSASEDDNRRLQIERPAGLSVTVSAHHLLVVCRDCRTICEFAPDGTPVRQVSSDDGSLMSYAVELDGGDRVLVARCGPSVHGVCVKSWDDGRTVASYGSEPPAFARVELRYPLCSAVDSKGFVFVADSKNGRVVVVDPSLQDACQLPLMDDCDGPDVERQSFDAITALCYDEPRGRLYVGEYGTWNRVLVYDNVGDVSALFT